MTTYSRRYFRFLHLLPGLKAVLGLTALLLANQVYALGLGNLRVLSALDEPLIAEIELTSVEEGALDSLQLNLGSKEAFNQAGIPRESFLRDLAFSLVKGAQPKVRIETTQPVKEPFLHFLVRAEWDDGNLLREYTALLDPPLYVRNKTTAVSSPGIVETAQELAASPPTEDSSGGTASGDAMAPQPATASLFGSAEYGPTVKGDTLWSIASQFDTRAYNANVFQVMIALLKQNPDAFIDNNINRMKTGQILRLSALDAVAKEEASRIYQDQLVQWESFKMEVAEKTELVKVPAEVFSAASPATSAAAKSAEPAPAAKVATDSEDNAASEQDLLKIVRATLEGEEGMTEGSDTDSALAAARADSEKETGALRGQITTLEESLVSSELQNRELLERVTLLEDQMVNAQRLLELESQELALVQQQAARQQEERQFLEQQLVEQQAQAEQAQADQVQADQAQADQARADQARVDQARVDQARAEAEKAAAQQAEAEKAQVELAAANQQSAADNVKKTRIDPRQDDVAAAQNVSQGPQPKAWWENITGMFAGVLGGIAGIFASITDMFAGSSITLVAGAAGALVLLVAAILFIRRRRSIAEFEESILSGSGLDGQTDTTDTGAANSAGNDTSFLSDFGMAGMGSMQADEVDPLAEAEVYLAYGRDEQAEEVLKEAATRNPERHELKLKLLEIYQQRDDLKSFETLAEELYPAGGQGDPVTWGKVVEMGTKMNPHNPLFAQELPGGIAGAATGDGSEPLNLDMPDLQPPATMSDSDLPGHITGQASDPIDPALHPFPPPDKNAGVDEELDQLAAQADSNASGAVEAEELKPSSQSEDADIFDFASEDVSELDFNIELEGSGESAAKGADAVSDAESEDNSIQFDIGDLTLQTNSLGTDDDTDRQLEGADNQTATDELQLDDDSTLRMEVSDDDSTLQIEGFDDHSVLQMEKPDDKSSAEELRAVPKENVTRKFDVIAGGNATEEHSGNGGAEEDTEGEFEKWDEAGTKLDLAQAYLNMGDKAGARSIIDEVMKEGSPAQKDQAAEIEAQLG